jgi:hypothetical protein
LIYLAARWCADRGELHYAGDDGDGDGALADRTAVLVMARRALRWAGYWNDAAIATERGLAWSDANLVHLAMRNDGPGDVALYATQLLDLDRRQRIARRCWRRMTEVLDGWGKSALDGVSGPQRRSCSSPGRADRSSSADPQRRSDSSPGRADRSSFADLRTRGGERLGEGPGGLQVRERGSREGTRTRRCATRPSPRPSPRDDCVEWRTMHMASLGEGGSVAAGRGRTRSARRRRALIHPFDKLRAGPSSFNIDPFLLWGCIVIQVIPELVEWAVRSRCG